MRVEIHNSEDLTELFIASLINNTDKISKISLHSALSAVGFGVGKVANKTLKEVALFESRKFPSYAHGENLDFAAGEFGIGARLEASTSSVVLRIIADVGTEYLSSTHQFTGTHGVLFEMTDDSVVVGSSGIAFIPVRSTSVGSDTKVIANSIRSVTPAPTGHKFVTNDYMAMGGRDVEDDMSYRARIKDAGNIAASSTLAKLTQALIAIDSDVLRVIRTGINSLGQTTIAIMAKNGKLWSQADLLSFLESTEKYFTIEDIRSDGSSEPYGVLYTNVEYYPIDIDFRVVIDESQDPDDVRRRIQLNMLRLIDYRTIDINSYKFEWDDAMALAKKARGVRYIPDAYFIPNNDISVPSGLVPRFRQFIMRDSSGNIISDSGSDYSPVYYPNIVDVGYERTFL